MAASSPELVTSEERVMAVSAFNEFYKEQHKDYQARAGNYPNDDFLVLEAGVRMATGQVAVDPVRAIPDSYQGDGSFTTPFKVDGEHKTEYISYDKFSMPAALPWRRDHHNIVERYSRRFSNVHPVNRERVEVEALFRSINIKEATGAESTEADDKWNFQMADRALRERRAIVLPVVGTRKPEVGQLDK